MTPILFCALSLAGGVGASCRFVIDGVVKDHVVTRFPGSAGRLPWATFLINASGSLLMGLLTGFVSTGILAPEWQQLAGVGFLGGYTTFSTASVETVDLLRHGRKTAGLVYAAGTLSVTVLAAAVGLWAGSAAV
ncbi:fluoride efflux transporter FluC [Corynebacterium neomassiliense]|uniref:fluoride efflux transporter FluC n=1 Tax=Corynebacterium neomassiliense TaxID=2079482 RepID=UPI00102F4970|nr:CrcB family protein [Corynebacterium neomassiliense]